MRLQLATAAFADTGLVAPATSLLPSRSSPRCVDDQQRALLIDTTPGQLGPRGSVTTGMSFVCHPTGGHERVARLDGVFGIVGAVAFWMRRRRVGRPAAADA
jgi:hypothetical protein